MSQVPEIPGELVDVLVTNRVEVGKSRYGDIALECGFRGKFSVKVDTPLLMRVLNLLLLPFRYLFLGKIVL